MAKTQHKFSLFGFSTQIKRQSERTTKHQNFILAKGKACPSVIYFLPFKGRNRSLARQSNVVHFQLPRSSSDFGPWLSH
jgi:hypothetical protein